MEKSASSVTSNGQSKSPRKKENDQMNIFNQINLNFLFTNDEIEELVNETTFGLKGHLDMRLAVNDEDNAKNKNQYSFDRMSLILKFLQISIEKLNNYKQTTVAKGLEWVKSEIQDSLIFKSDEKTLKHLGKLREENQDIQLILNWVEEYSTLNLNQNVLVNGNNNQISSKKKNSMNSNDLPKNSVFDHNLGIEKFEKNLVDVTTEFETILALQNHELKNDPTFLSFSEESVITIEEANFDIFELEKSIGKENTLPTVSCFIFMEMGLYSVINYSNFENFIEFIRQGYNRKNSYHHDLHAADVEQTCYLFFRYGNLKESLRLNDIDCAGFLISAIIHDFKHPGFTNSFLINSKNDIALRYNDQSVLENYHVSEAFNIIHTQPEANIFSELSREEYKVIRKRIIDCVLATDMTLHNKEYSYMKLKCEACNITDGKNTQKIFENLDNMGIFSTQQEILNTLIHTADISNPTKPLKIYEKWVHLVMDEFWQQGDKEKEMSLPISFLCDRVTTKVPASQIGFMDGIVYPLVQIVVAYLPGMNFMIENINTNKTHFKKIKEEEDEKNNKK